MQTFDWFDTIAGGSELSAGAATELRERGFVVLPCLASSPRMDRLGEAYTSAEASATGDDIRIGNTSTRVTDFVNRGPAFDDLYLFPPLLEAGCQVIGGPFKLSSFQSRSLHAGAPSKGLHVDVPRDSADWPLLGFILMVDAFRPENGATCFLPGSHRGVDPAEDSPAARGADVGQLPACGA